MCPAYEAMVLPNSPCDQAFSWPKSQLHLAKLRYECYYLYLADGQTEVTKGQKPDSTSHVSPGGSLGCMHSGLTYLSIQLHMWAQIPISVGHLCHQEV